MPLPEGTRICHLRTNMGTDWADNVVPLLPELGAKPTDIVVRSSMSLSECCEDAAHEEAFACSRHP